MFKGDASGPISIRCSGGRLVLPDGHTVTVHTPESDNLHIGEDYFVFLKSQDGTLGLADGIQGLFRVTPDGDRVQLLDPDKSRTPELRYLEGARIATLEQEIRNVKN